MKKRKECWTGCRLYNHYPCMPIGRIATSSFLKEIGHSLKISQSCVNSLIDQYEKRYEHYFCRIAQLFNEYRPNFPDQFIIIGNSHISTAIANFLENELGFSKITIFITDDIPEKYQKNITSLLLKTDIFITKNQKEIEEKINLITQGKKNFIMGSCVDAFIAKATQSYFLEIAHPLSGRLIFEQSYCGYAGALLLIEDIFNTINHICW